MRGGSYLIEEKNMREGLHYLGEEHEWRAYPIQGRRGEA